MDYTGVSCKACAGMLKAEGAEPECFEGQCRVLIDRLGPGETRALSLRHRLIMLQDLVGPAAVMDMFCATETDLTLLLVIEEERKKANENNYD